MHQKLGILQNLIQDTGRGGMGGKRPPHTIRYEPLGARRPSGGPQRSAGCRQRSARGDRHPLELNLSPRSLRERGHHLGK
jgi:hypothetical protein